MRSVSVFSILIVLTLAVTMSACSVRGQAVADSSAAEAASATSTPLTCKTAADCTVKDVGNCCGYFPACVHRDQAVDPEAVKAQCERDGRAGICGFAEISSCACSEGQCVSSGADDGGDPT
jgi:hypothetical protein